MQLVDLGPSSRLADLRAQHLYFLRHEPHAHSKRSLAGPTMCVLGRRRQRRRWHRYLMNLCRVPSSQPLMASAA
jgi:hypothetical protein